MVRRIEEMRRPEAVEEAYEEARRESLDALAARYTSAMHAMQSAVAVALRADNPGLDDRTLRALKHLRVGINAAMSDHGALTWLLIRKGVITEPEYRAALATFADIEAESNAEEARRKAGLADGVTFR